MILEKHIPFNTSDPDYQLTVTHNQPYTIQRTYSKRSILDRRINSGIVNSVGVDGGGVGSPLDRDRVDGDELGEGLQGDGDTGDSRQ